MTQLKEQMNKNSHVGICVTWGIVAGSMIGLFSGIFWFEMGLSLLFGTAFGLIIGSAIGYFLDNKNS